jgi:hypothetical protein
LFVDLIVKRVPSVLLVLAVTSSLTACSWKGQTIDPNVVDRAQAIADSKVVLPPSKSASRVYRCRDNSIVYVDFLSDALTANLRTAENGPIIRLQASTPDKPLSGGGYALAGHGTRIALTKPSGKAEVCTA